MAQTHASQAFIRILCIILVMKIYVVPFLVPISSFPTSAKIVENGTGQRNFGRELANLKDDMITLRRKIEG